MNEAPDRNTWSTPDPLFNYWHSIYQFTLDVCATDENTKCQKWYTPEMDGLRQSWAGERVWCNPPYGKGLLEPWVTKALEGAACVTVMLLPVRTDMPWCQRLLKEADSMKFLTERVRFVPPAGVAASSPTERSLVAVIYGR